MDGFNFDDASKKELEQFIQREQAGARIQASIHQHTSMCWDKCITGTPSTRFSRGEESCLANCVERFLDTSLFMVKQLENQRTMSS